MAEPRRTGRSLEVLRAEAAEEISMLVEHRSRQGEDPWEFMPTLPTVDEQVVLILRADAVDLDDGDRQAARAVVDAPGVRAGHQARRGVPPAAPDRAAAPGADAPPCGSCMGALPEAG